MWHAFRADYRKEFCKKAVSLLLVNQKSHMSLVLVQQTIRYVNACKGGSHIFDTCYWYCLRLRVFTSSVVSLTHLFMIVIFDTHRIILWSDVNVLRVDTYRCTLREISNFSSKNSTHFFCRFSKEPLLKNIPITNVSIHSFIFNKKRINPICILKSHQRDRRFLAGKPDVCNMVSQYFVGIRWS